jgi:tRNA (cmo5U34)-methyltransferase
MSKSDNTTAHGSKQYDSQVKNTIPYYESFHKEIINFVKSTVPNTKIWVDTGCGTGSLVEKAINEFANTKFILLDPSIAMLNQAKSKFIDFSKDRVEFLEPTSSQDVMLNDDKKADIVTAIQAHHYLSKEERAKATKKCYDILNESGIYITFENISPLTKDGVEIGKEYWRNFQIEAGKEPLEAENHIKRFGMEYFPITIEEHLSLLRSTGFKVVELFWYSYMQAGFYCIK